MSGLTRCGSGAGFYVWDEWMPPVKTKCCEEPEREEEASSPTVSSEASEPADNRPYEKILTVDPYL